jgi:hypothetical protein
MAVQQALAAKNMNDVCDNKYVKMAYMAGNIHPQLQQALNLLGCNGPNRKYGGNNNKDKFGVSTTPGFGVSTTPGYNNNEDNDNEEDASDNQNDDTNDGGNLQSGFPPEKQSKLQNLLSIARGEKGAKRNFIKSLFGLNKKDKTFKPGQKLPSSSYKLDKDDANSLKNLEKEIEDHHNVNH